MITKLKLWALASSVVALLCAGCGTIDVTVPDVRLDYSKIGDENLAFEQLSSYARGYEGEYRDRAQNAAWMITGFEGTILGAAAVAAGLAIKEPKANANTITDIGIGALSLAAIENYASPRQRLPIYLQAANAMSCLAGLSNRVQFDYTKTHIRAFVDTLDDAALTNYHLDASFFSKVRGFHYHAIDDLISAINIVNTGVVNRLLNVSAMPNYAQIRDQLTTSMRSAVEAGPAADAASKELGKRTGRESGPQPPTESQLRRAFDLIAEFDLLRQSCVTTSTGS
jgi:hypothetical protein